MPKKRVVAYFMHESERAAATARISNAQETDTYLVGDVEENDIEVLKKSGLMVQAVGELPAIRSTGRRGRAASRLRPAGAGAGARMGVLAAGDVTAALPEAGFGEDGPAMDSDDPDFYLVQIRGPLVRKWRADLEASGIKLLEKLGRGTYVAKMSSNQAAQIQSLPFVAGATPYDTEGADSLSDATPAAASGSPPTGAVRMQPYDIRLHSADDLTAVGNKLKSRGVPIAGAAGRKIRVYLVADSNLAQRVGDLQAIRGVAKVEAFIEPQLHNDVARVLLGIDPKSNPGVGLTQTGQGEIVAVADTGLDDTHPDFQGRIHGVVALGRAGDFSDPHGHGTHVAGSVLGDGAASGNKYRGAAPGAKLFFQSLLDSQMRLGGLPLNLEDLFDEAYQQGARIHNNSWGAIVDSEYTMNSLEVDEYVAKKRDMLIVISAGNEGQGARLSKAKQGFVEWLSIGSPASCKNGLTVGASRSLRSNGGYSKLTYGDVWPSDFPHGPIATHKVSGDPESLACFSSRGLCTDHRVKPDVVAPGTDILSAKSSRAPLKHFWGPGPTPQYAYMGGTSMAAPLVAGCAALVREYFVKDRGISPSAALVKAALINSTRRLTGEDATADFGDLPNMHQGFGCISMPWAIPNPVNPKLRLEFVDSWKDPARIFHDNGQRFRYRFKVGGAIRLSVCLAWTDPPGRALQNNLNLVVERFSDRKKWPGNEKLPLSMAPVDQENNVELVRLDAPDAGEYWIHVFANNLLTADQDFALVVTGDLTTGMTAV